MAFEDDFLELLTSTCSHRTVASHDLYGKSTWAASDASFPAHVMLKKSIVRGNSEESADSTAQVWAPPPGWHSTPTLAIPDKIVLPDGSEHIVLRVDVHYDEDGAPHHQVAFLT